ncbi:uncharacterized protein NEMAJ01_1397 [Nematocida major]|uniref:uncharacterized protein n=1 Tax=Nematocida major TaxID=1912982 RepID=UPI002008B2EC|nr:uncharacterized protein NEMAJ01_1397 [Nematocida major]KAH9386501.1 hypothetical protein NEMAJ01_1397 [Nematocida major]
MQIRFLLGLLMPHLACAQLSISELKTSLQHTISTPDGDVCINPEGPLNMIHGYIYKKRGYMYNKRLFSPEIQTKYSMAALPREGDSEEAYAYRRIPTQDTAHKKMESDVFSLEKTLCPVDDYTQEYHNTLIRLFPSVDGELSIETSQYDAFIRFIRAKQAKEHAHYILASLLLLSEGVDVDIKCTKKEISLRSRDTKEIFQVCTEIQVLNPKTNALENSYQKRAVSVIRFFQKYKKVGEMPKTRQELKTGKFLSTPQFLIQSYIFEYTNGAEDAILLAEKVHELLGDMIEEAKEKRLDERLAVLTKAFSVFFTPIHLVEDKVNCIQSIAALRELTEELVRFPFPHQSQVPSQIGVPSYSRSTDSFYSDSLHNFQNCVEASTYALMCCLAYNPESAYYSLSTMPNASEELKKFFLEHKKPVEFTSNSMYREWNRVVSDLPCERIIYNRKNRNELRSGVLNLLRVVLSITGNLEGEEDTLADFMREVENSTCKKDSVFSRVERYVEALLARLSVNTSAVIRCSGFKKRVRKDGLADIYGDIEIKHFFGGVEQGGMCLRVKNKHMTASTTESMAIEVTEDEIQALKDRVREHENREVFSGVLAAQHVDDAFFYGTNGDSVDTLIRLSRVILSNILNTQQTSANALFMLKEFKEPWCKSFLAIKAALFLKSTYVRISKDLPIFRLASNIVGSCQLDDPSVHDEMLAPFAFIGSLDSLAPEVQLSDRKRLHVFNQVSLSSLFVVQMNDPGTRIPFSSFVSVYRQETKQPFSCFSGIERPESVIALFSCFYRGESKDCVDSFFDALDQERTEDARMVKATLKIAWLGLALLYPEISSSTIKRLYREIDDFMYNEHHPIFSMLFEHREKLHAKFNIVLGGECQPEDRHKFFRLIIIFDTPPGLPDEHC